MEDSGIQDRINPVTASSPSWVFFYSEIKYLSTVILLVHQPVAGSLHPANPLV
jgi:hypothetical protein